MAPASRGRDLLRELGIEYPAGTTFDPNVVRDYNIRGMPTTLFIHADGHLPMQTIARQGGPYLPLSIRVFPGG